MGKSRKVRFVIRDGFRNRDNFINRSETGEMPIVREDEDRDTKKTRN